MIVAINTIKIKSGHVAEVVERFKNPKGVQHAPGFVRMELLTESLAEHDELKVCTTWEDRAAFDSWVNSDAFKQAHAHARPKPEAGAEPAAHPGGHGEQARPGGGIMLGAKLSVHDVVFAYPSN
ncbi:antibiotic biosynthesis monooxygenase [Cohnella rhizosphaerae]|uniref:Antibiotic biosynthesis monooxygenase n=1 Tax=Cohnella rhizosphaerae TaxID=1457232 RepID=A0A9X4KTQ1_9BACL|nr:antibiotic biosynthesis monooxygenase [Cohnella rhizosphaerae]MDG0810722.1 antibiotic biosynthesis monooxygenase [Cohnella rhizosphaerae]